MVGNPKDSNVRKLPYLHRTLTYAEFVLVLCFLLVGPTCASDQVPDRATQALGVRQYEKNVICVVLLDGTSHPDLQFRSLTPTQLEVSQKSDDSLMQFSLSEILAIQGYRSDTRELIPAFLGLTGASILTLIAVAPYSESIIEGESVPPQYPRNRNAYAPSLLNEVITPSTRISLLKYSFFYILISELIKEMRGDTYLVELGELSNAEKYSLLNRQFESKKRGILTFLNIGK